MADSIIQQIRDDEEDFRKDIKITKGLTFNHPQTVQKNILYNNSSFKSSDEDPTTGFKKFFYNINLTPAEVARKSIEFDTKDFRFMTDSGGTTTKTWFFEQDFKYWAKQNNFGQILNGIFKRVSRAGSAVVKTVDGEPHFVDLRNFIIEPSADSIEEANYIIEKHRYTPVDFAKAAESNDWDNKDEILTEFRKTTSKYIRVFERYGELTEEQIDDGSSTDYEYARAMYAEVTGRNEEIDSDDDDAPDQTSFSLVVETYEVDDVPYDAFHMDKIPGRWLGKGITERLWQPQQRINELINLQVRGSYYASLNLFQTLDTDMERNLLTDVANGDVLEVEEGVEQIPMNQNNLQALMQEQQQWLSNRDEMSFSSKISRGGRLPSGTTLGSIKMSAQNANQYFDVIRENIGLRLKEYFKDKIIPQFEKYANSEHRLLVTGEKLDKLQKLDKQRAMDKWRNEFYRRNHKPPTKAQRDITEQYVESQLEGERERSELIEEDFYDNFEYKFDIIITGESSNLQAQSANLQMALQAVTSDPEVTKDPIKRALFFKVLESGGISPESIMDKANEQSQMGSKLKQMRSAAGQMQQQSQQRQRGGGGVARPQMPRGQGGGQQQQQRI